MEDRLLASCNKRGRWQLTLQDHDKLFHWFLWRKLSHNERVFLLSNEKLPLPRTSFQLPLTSQKHVMAFLDYFQHLSVIICQPAIATPNKYEAQNGGNLDIVVPYVPSHADPPWLLYLFCPYVCWLRFKKSISFFTVTGRILASYDRWSNRSIEKKHDVSIIQQQLHSPFLCIVLNQYWH